MKLFLVHAPAGRRARFPVSFPEILALVAVCLFAAPQLAAQTQSLAVNRAIVSSGVPAVPPTARTSPLRALDPVLAAISLGPAPPIELSSKQGIFGLVGLSPDQLVQVTVQYSAPKTGRLIIAEALDGGQIIGQAIMVVGVDHAIHFQFRAAHATGFNHIALREGSRAVGLQFWVLDTQHPERNPPVVNP
jgi:hypothetical protein